ncbi:MAG: hypothetical protein EXR09_04610 [Acetobacteraceae bacterium]|nr:hypothetical protein [Acetobacteraceae bacterium]
MIVRFLAVAALVGLLTAPAMAQMDPRTGARVGREPSVGPSYLLSPNASNIQGSGAYSTIATILPSASVGEDATAWDLLMAARAALSAGRTGEAQEVMERA